MARRLRRLAVYGLIAVGRQYALALWLMTRLGGLAGVGYLGLQPDRRDSRWREQL
jgi:hypothetical protein